MCQARPPSMPPPEAQHEAKASAMDVKLFGKSRVAGQGSHRSEVGKVLIMILFRRVESAGPSSATTICAVGKSHSTFCTACRSGIETLRVTCRSRMAQGDATTGARGSMGFHDELRKTLSLVGNLVEILGALVFLCAASAGPMEIGSNQPMGKRGASAL